MQDGRLLVKDGKNLIFRHEDDFGQVFTQGYQYCQIASCSSDVLRARYTVKLEVQVEQKMSKR